MPLFLKLPLLLLATLFFAASAPLPAADDSVTVDLATRTWQGIPGLERTAKGRVFASWFTGGPKEPSPENTVVLSYSDDGSKTFTAPQAMGLPKADGTRCFDPTLWIDPKGRLWYIFNRGNKDTAVHDVWARICENPDAKVPVFGAEFRVGYEAPFAFRMNKPTVLSTGEWLMPVTHAAKPINAWSTGYNEAQEPTLHGVGISTDEGKTWKLHGAVKSKPWALENMIVELKDGRLWMLIRTSSGVLWEGHSADKGRTWSEGHASTIASPGSRFFIRRLASGNLLLVNHYKFKGRSHLTAQLSADDGATWNDGLLLDERSNVSYPDGVQDRDGLIWITYDRDRNGAGEILLAKFREEDVAAGKNVSGAVTLKQVINKLDKPKLVPGGWDPALAGDKVLGRLVRVSAPQAKGAHDAEFVCVGEQAYIVEHDNDVQPGHGAGNRMYCVLSMMNLKTLTVEKVIPMAKSEQVFANETLPDGVCFVPRILKLNETTLRCYFTCEDQSGKGGAQMWYRDFDLPTLAFEPGIHKARLKTAAGTFDMQPGYFHADAAALGFKRPPLAFGFFIFDSFKEFDGKTYVALNNFPGKQNALALLHEDRVTFEVIGHYNEPQSQQLSESAVNRLPDGTWMAICRNDIGNYHFTTSTDGRTWSAGKEMPFVQNGLNSKPTFDQFGGVYYLGWQEATRIQECNRSVFNVDISRDGKAWERKYRFETQESFQYPTFHEHDGAIWLSVSQSDHKGTTDRIMFGKLEDVGQFASQAGKVRQSLPQEQAAAARASADAKAELPVILTNPGAEFQDEARPGAMIIGMDRTPKGRIWGCWTGTGDKKDGYFLLATSDDGGTTWSKPRLAVGAVTSPGQRLSGALVGNLWTDPRGRLWLFFDQQLGDPEKRITNWFIRCDEPDAAEPKWSEPVMFAEGCTLNKPTVLKNGDWLLPVSDWHQKTARVFASTDEGATWKERGSLQFPDWQFDEHMMVELRDGRLWMLARTNGNPHESFSSDQGATWSEPKPSAIQNVNARFFLRRLASGKLLLVKNGTPTERLTKRTHLSAFLSDDDGKTWSGGLLLDERNAVSYPDGFQSPDGLIHILYDWNRHTDAEILMAKFREEDVLAGKVVSGDAKLQMLVNKALLPVAVRPDLKWAAQAAKDAKQDFSSIPYDGVTPNKMVCDTTLRELPDGSWILFMLAGGDTEPSPLNYTGVTRSTDKGKTWTPLERFDVGFPREGKTIGQGPTELMILGSRATLFFSTHSKHWANDWRSWFLTSDDSFKTWSAPQEVPGRLKERTFIRKHIVCKDGRIMLPFQHYIGPDAEQDKAPLDRAFTNPRNGVLISSDGGKTWTEHGNIRLTPNDRYFGWAENDLFEHPDGRITMVIRGDGLGGRLWKAESKDGGVTWPEFASPTPIPNPGSKTTLYNLGGDRVAILHNPNSKHRSPMALWISFDGMKTWPYQRVLQQFSVDGPNGRMNYPDGFVSADGEWLHFAFDDNRHRAVHYSAKLPPAK